MYETADTSPVATLRSWDTAMTVPGGEVAADAISSIGVRATHRRRGLLRALLVDDLAEAVRAGTPVAALTSTQGSLYERFGFGLATWTRSLTLDTRAARFRDAGARPAASGPSTRRASPRSRGRCQDRARRRHPGSMDRSAASWHAADHRRASTTCSTPLRGRLGRRDRPPRRVRRLRRSPSPGGAPVPPKLAVHDLQATTPESYRELWRHLASLDLVGRWGGRTPRSTNRSRGCSPTTAR